MRRILTALFVFAVGAAACTTGDGTTDPPTPSTTAAAVTTTATTTTTAAPEPEAPWWEGRVFYEVFVRSFQDTDGDGIGDIEGLIDRLDYLNDGDPTTGDDLGVTGIWLMPVMQSPSYHGYDVTDYREVNFQYGSNDDFRRLVEEAHERGIAVIVDLVLNHTSKSHPWFGKSFLGQDGFDDWYLWEDRSPGGGWHAAGDRSYFGLFWEGMPDLNLENPAVTGELYDIADFWLTDMGVDGFRLDAVKHFIEDGNRLENTPATIAWASDFNAHTEATKPGALTVGEIWNDTRIVAGYVPESVDLAFEFTFATEAVNAAQSGRASTLVPAMETILELYPQGQFAPFLSNHDQDRIASVFVGDASKGKLAASLLLTVPGVPFVYYGEEIGLRGRKPDERIRTPMPWDGSEFGGFSTSEPWEAFDAEPSEVNVTTQLADRESLLSHYRALIGLRAQTPALAVGDMTILDTGSDAIFAFTRATEEQRVLVIINLAKDPQTFMPGIETGGASLLFGEPWTAGDELPGRSTTILELG